MYVIAHNKIYKTLDHILLTLLSKSKLHTIENISFEADKSLFDKVLTIESASLLARSSTQYEGLWLPPASGALL